MRRGKGKGKKQNVTASRDEEETVLRRRGRPLKTSDIKEEDVIVTVEEDDYDADGSVSDTHLRVQGVAENGKKRKITVLSEEDLDIVKEENSDLKAQNGSSSNSAVGYRQNGSRRKNKPRRAAEAVVECIGV